MNATARNHLREPRPGDRWLVVVAHPDDETFGCGSLIAHAASYGAAVTVACATRGEAGEPPDGIAPEELGDVREGELCAAGRVLGVAHIALLGYFDSGFDGDIPEGSLCAAPIEEVTARVNELFDEIDPHVVVTLDGSDGHRDHLWLRAAVHRVAEGRGDTPVEVYEHCLPNRLMRRWLDEMRATRPDTAYHSIDPSELGRPDDQITDTLDVGHLIELRQLAIDQHPSQVSPFVGLSPELRLAFLGCDHLARA